MMLQEALIGVILIVFGLVYLGTSVKDGLKGAAVESAIMVVGGACVIGAAVCFGTGGAH